jgi:hypothetical protein
MLEIFGDRAAQEAASRAETAKSAGDSDTEGLWNRVGYALTDLAGCR